MRSLPLRRVGDIKHNLYVNLRLTACPGDAHSAAGSLITTREKCMIFFTYRLVFYVSYFICLSGALRTEVCVTETRNGSVAKKRERESKNPASESQGCPRCSVVEVHAGGSGPLAFSYITSVNHGNYFNLSF